MNAECKCEKDFGGSEYSRLAGRISAIHKYLDDAGIEKHKDVNMRAKLISIKYQELLLENKRLRLMLEMKS